MGSDLEYKCIFVFQRKVKCFKTMVIIFQQKQLQNSDIDLRH